MIGPYRVAYHKVGAKPFVSETSHSLNEAFGIAAARLRTEHNFDAIEVLHDKGGSGYVMFSNEKFFEDCKSLGTALKNSPKNSEIYLGAVANSFFAKAPVEFNLIVAP